MNLRRGELNDEKVTKKPREEEANSDGIKRKGDKIRIGIKHI